MKILMTDRRNILGMILTGTVVVDSETVVEEGAVVTADTDIVAVGSADRLVEQYPDHEQRHVDIVAPGLINTHVHTVQSLGRGLADDVALLEWLQEAILPLEASLDAAATEVAAKLGYLELLESGVTACVDHPTVAHTDAVFEAAGELGIRARLGKVLMDRDGPASLLEETETGLAETTRLLETYHNSYDGRITYAVTPRFAISCTEDCLRGARDIAREHNVPIHTHASETQAEVEMIKQRTGKRNIEYLHDVGLTGPDVILAHGVWTAESERQLLADTDTRIVHCPSANMKLASGIAPIADYIDRGLTVGIGNDGPPCNNTLDPFTELRQASLLAKVGALDPTQLDARTVFRMATEAGAVVGGFDRVGALREGYRADIIGLETSAARATPVRDPLSHLVYSAHGDDVCLVLVDGTVRYDDGHVGVDAAAIKERARDLLPALHQ